MAYRDPLTGEKLKGRPRRSCQGPDCPVPYCAPGVTALECLRKMGDAVVMCRTPPCDNSAAPGKGEAPGKEK
jgi:hypothetical protein